MDQGAPPAPHSTDQPAPVVGAAGSQRLDPASGLPLPDPFPDYIACPKCGEAEVEVWCYETEVTCHRCGNAIAHTPPPWCGTWPFCKRAAPSAGPSGEA